MKTAHTLHYKHPASDWNEALPLGCGELGALVYGRYDVEDIPLNNDTFWAGLPVKNDYKQNGLYLNVARSLIDEGKYEEATALIEKHMLGETVEAYLPIGHIKLEFGQSEARDYKLSLDLSQALYSCEYKVGNAIYRREGFISHPHDAFFQRFEANGAPLEFCASLYSDIRSSASFGEDGSLRLCGYAPIHSVGSSDRNFKTVYDDSKNANRNNFEVRLFIVSDGKLFEDAEAKKICVSGASYAEIICVSATSFVDWKSMPSADPADKCQILMSRALSDGYEKAKQKHIEDFSSLYGRAELTLDTNENSALPTDERLSSFAQNDGDAELCALYYHYGRYLMIASEREGSQPGTLQGIWNSDPKPIWECDMHTNINLEMNYWCAENANLSECRTSLLSFLKNLCESGKKTARDLQNCRGSCAYSTTDIWCKTTPTSGCAVWGYWPMGEAWLAMDIFDHYEYTGDIDFLAEYYDVLRENVQFLYDWTYFDERTGYFVTSPSTSPEHAFHYISGDGEEHCAPVSKASTGDMSIVREIFSDFVKASELLCRDDELVLQIRERMEKLYPYRIAGDGMLAEWFLDFEPHEKGHRHVSHLLSVYPGGLINKNDTPELFEAARRSLETRIENGGGNTGWSCAWAMALFAKFGDGERFGDCVKRLLRDSTCPNLLDLHPPHIFQIDGNFGATAAFGEMLVQSEVGEIVLLPCLPEFMKNGSARGLRAKGGITVDLEWQDGMLTHATLTSDRDSKLRARYGNEISFVEIKAGESFKIDIA